jgi:TolB-like protein
MPVGDTALAAFFAAAMTNITLNPASGSTSSSRNVALAIDATLGLFSIASAIYGYPRVAKCKRQVAALNQMPLGSTTASTFSAPPSPRPVPVPAPAQRNQRLAVLEFQGKDLEPDVLMTFSDTVRGGVLQAVEGYGIVVMTRENMLVLLREKGGRECSEGDCEVETARNLGADYVVSGKVVHMERTYVITLKLHETKGGNLLSSDTIDGASQVELLRALREHGRQLMTSAFGPGQNPAVPNR